MADRLHPGQSLTSEQGITSANGRALLTMQGDGNLVMYEYFASGERAYLWDSNTAGNPGASLAMQGDGNLVVYRSDGHPLWDSGTWGNDGSTLVLQDDGNLVVYRPDGHPLWASGTDLSYRKVGFSAAQHGFAFPNQFVNVLANLPGTGEIKTRGRCGGMAFAALDYWHAGAPVPTWRGALFSPGEVPPDGHWLADYVYGRLLDSFLVGSAVKFAEWSVHSDHETWLYKGVTRWCKEEEFPKLMASLRAGQPVPLGLVQARSLGAIGDNHQVVAYGFEHDRATGRMTVNIYDNNAPGSEVTLTSDAGQANWTASSGGPWRGFFVQDYSPRTPRVLTGAPAALTQQVTFGRTLKLSHVFTGYTLHSHPATYGHPGSSGQQQVTCFGGSDDNDLWAIAGPDGTDPGYRAGQAVRHGDVVRLRHVLTGRNLHSHSGHPSPVTRQQEVTAYGENGVGDGNDSWVVEVDGGGTWTAARRVRLVHVATGVALHSHAGASHDRWTSGQQEVTGFPGRDNNDWWTVLEVR